MAARNQDGESGQVNSRGSDEVSPPIAIWFCYIWEHLIRQARMIPGTLSRLGFAPDTFPCEGKAFGAAEQIRFFLMALERKSRSFFSFATFFPGSILRSMLYYACRKGKRGRQRKGTGLHGMAPWSNGQDTGISILRCGFDSRRGYFQRHALHGGAACPVYDLVVQWQNSGLSIRGCGFDPHPGRSCAFNSAVEYLAFNQGAKGSNPLRRIHASVTQW